MSYNNKPITAKIKKTTKGGMISQPVLNMGAPVKMKASSPAKKDGNTDGKDFKSKYDAIQKSKADAEAQAVIAKKASDLSSYKNKLSGYRKDVLNSHKAAKPAEGSGYGARGQRGNRIKGINDKKAEKKRISDFENNLYNYDKKNKPGITDKYDTAKKYALAKASGTIKSKKKKEIEEVVPKNEKEIEEVVPKKTTKITGKIGSDLRRKQYKAKGWAMDDTTSKPKAKSSGAVAVKPSKKETIKPKLASKKESPKPKTDKQIRKNKSIDRKQGKADKARSEGNFKKAARKERAIEKKKARMKKRSGYQGQAASAINPN